jgi:hypothetical protein
MSVKGSSHKFIEKVANTLQNKALRVTAHDTNKNAAALAGGGVDGTLWR